MKNTPKEIHIIIPVWGEEYVSFFLNYSLQSQLTPNNLPFLSQQIPLVYKIYTDPNSIKIFKSSSAIVQLKSITKLELYNMEEIGILKDSFMGPISEVYNHCLTETVGQNVAIMPLTADIIYCNDFYSDSYKFISSGYRVLYKLSSIRGMKKAFFEYLENFQGFEYLDKRSFKNFFFKVMSDADRDCISKNLIYAWPSTLYWEIDENNFYSQCCHLHPIYIWAELSINRPWAEGTIDNTSFIYSICPNLKKQKIIQGDRALMMEVSSEEHFLKAVGKKRKKSALYIDHFLTNMTGRTTTRLQTYHQFLFKKILFSKGKPRFFKLLQAKIRFSYFNFKLAFLLLIPKKFKAILFKKGFKKLSRSQARTGISK